MLHGCFVISLKRKDIPVSDDTQSPKSYVERFIDNLNEEK